MASSLNEPVLILTYGASGTGKTTDLAYSFPRALFVGPPSAFVSAETICGYRPAQVTTARNLDDVLGILEREAKVFEKTKRRAFDALIVDDLTIFADMQMQAFDDAGLSAEKNKYAFWGAMRKTMLELRTLMAQTGMHFIVNAHERNPHVDERKGWVAGGPALPGTMPVDMPKSFTAVFRVLAVEEGDATARSMLGWPYMYYASEADTQYVTKSRFGIYGNLPMNLGEMLRLFFGAAEDGPLSIRRHPQLPWQEETVEKLSHHFAAVPQDENWTNAYDALKRGAIEAVQAKHNTNIKIALWTVRDAKHRALLKQLQVQNTLRFL